MKPDLDQLLKSHLHTQLGPQLGKAAKTLRERMDEPEPAHAMRLGHVGHGHVRHRHIGRWIAVGLAIAACLLIAFILSTRPGPHPHDIAHETHDVSPNMSTDASVALPPIIYTRVVTNTDRGMVLLDDNHVGRRVSRNEVHHYRWTDESGAVYEYFAPSEQDLLLAVHQQ